jgi:aminodeoxyfutalosine synthase
MRDAAESLASTWETTMTTLLEGITEKIERGEALQHDETLALWQSTDLVSMGMLADDVRRRRHGNTATFLRLWTTPIAGAAHALVPVNAGEIRVTATAAELVAGASMLRELVARADGVPVSAGSLSEVERSVARPADRQGLFDLLHECGVEAIAAAELDRLIAPDELVGSALAAGLRVHRFVIERAAADPLPLMSRMQRLQSATGAARTFAPLARHQDTSQPTTGYSDMKVVALARLVLESVPSIQVDWSLHGPKVAQVALLFGADDLDGVSTDEESGSGRRRAPLEEIRRNILAASLTPIERDGRFRARDDEGRRGQGGTVPRQGQRE